MERRSFFAAALGGVAALSMQELSIVSVPSNPMFLRDAARAELAKYEEDYRRGLMSVNEFRVKALHLPPIKEQQC